MTNLVKAIAVMGLLVLGALIFRNTRVAVQPVAPERNSPGLSAAAKPEADAARRFVTVAPKSEFLPTPDFPSEELAKFLAELEEGTNATPYELKAEKLLTFVQNISTNDFPSAFRELCEMQKLTSTPAGRELQLRLLQRWTEFNLAAAVQALDQLQGTNRAEAYERIATAWAKQDLTQSLTWAQQLPEGTERQGALLSIVYEAAFKDPKQALVLASQMGIPAGKSDLINQAASTWAAEAPETAADWAKQIQDPPLREQVLAAIATSWADKDPAAAAQLILDSLPQGKEQDKAVMGIVQRLSFKDAETAKTWVAQFPEGPLKDTATEELNRIAKRQLLVQPAK